MVFDWQGTLWFFFLFSPQLQQACRKVLQLRWKENNFFWYSLSFCFCFTLYKLCGAILVENIDDNFNSSAKFSHLIIKQRAKKVVSDSLRLADFALGLVTSVLNLPDRQVMVFEEFKLKKNCEINSACQKAFGTS